MTMPMRLKEYGISVTEESHIVSGLIVSTEYCKRIKEYLDFAYFKNSYLKTLAEWSIAFFEEHGVAPFKHINTIFESLRPTLTEPDAVLVDELLTKIGDAYAGDDINVDYLSSEAEQYFRQRELEIHVNNISVLKDKGDLDEAEQEIARFNRVSIKLDENVYINPGDAETRERLYKKRDEQQSEFFRLPGDIGLFIGNIKPGDAIGITAPQKRGKCISGGNFIFLSDWTVKTAREVFDKKISNILCMNKSGVIVNGIISDWMYSGEKIEYTVYTLSGRVIKTSKDHKFHTPYGWMALKHIKIGCLVSVVKDKHYTYWDTIVSVKESDSLVEMYDFTVEENHNFIANSFIVHNSFLLTDFQKHAVMSNIQTLKWSIEMTDVEEIERHDKSFFASVDGKSGFYKYPEFDCLHNQMGGCGERNSPVIVKDSEKAPVIEDPAHIICTKCKDSPTEYQRFNPTTYKVEIYREQNSIFNVRKAMKKWLNRLNKYSRIVVRPKYSLTYDMMMRDFDIMVSRYGFIPRLLLLDYIDILQIASVFDDYRLEDEKWKLMQKIAGATGCAIITPTQGNKDSFNTNQIRSTDQAGFYGKGKHVNKMLAINQNAMEKKDGIWRIGMLESRSSHQAEDDFCLVLQDLKAGQFHLESYWQNKFQYNSMR